MPEDSQSEKNSGGNGRSGRSEDSGPVWTYRGYKLDPANFTTAMVHLFRAEIARANTWRQRLDMTTNWAVITTGASISLAFTERLAGHAVILLNALLITLLLYIEARRYRYYELWSYRVRLMETDFFATMLVPPFQPSHDWAEGLAENLLHPKFPISMLEAIGRRLRRNYIWMYLILTLAWFGILSIIPQPAASFSEMLSRAAMGNIEGWIVALVFLVFNILLLALALVTVGLQQAAGEVLPRFGEQLPVVDTGEGQEAEERAWYRHPKKRSQYMATIVTDRAEEVGELILEEMHRGVTALRGMGMYTHRPHNVLLCALTVTEVPQLKALVHEADERAFIILSPAQEILGGGFAPLEPKRD